jgi:hypothetical protein
MYNKFEDNDLILEKIHLNSKMLSISVLHLNEFFDPAHHHLLVNPINRKLDSFLENDVPSYVALASNAPAALNDLHSDAVKNRIKSVNQHLDQQFGTSADSFAERKDVLERVFQMFRNADLMSTEQIDMNADTLRNTLNHPDAPNMHNGVRLRPLLNGEIEKYDFSSEATSDLFNWVKYLENDINHEFKNNKFLFNQDIEEDKMMRGASSIEGYDYPRQDLRLVSIENDQLANKVRLINMELDARNTLPVRLITEDRTPNGAHPAIIGYDRNDRDRALGR